MKLHRLCLPFITGFSLAVLLLLGAAWQSATATAPNRPAAATLHYVATTGTDTGDCTAPATPCRTIQYAVDHSGPGDEIRVAEGIYSDVHYRTFSYPDLDTYEITQTIFLTQSMSILGGYSESNWAVSDPVAHPTIIDPLHRGIGVSVFGDFPIEIVPTHVRIEGLTIQNGQPGSYSIGGGLWAIGADLQIRHTNFYNNQGCLSHLYGDVIFEENTFQNNTSGCLVMSFSTLTMTHNSFLNNQLLAGASRPSIVTLEYSTFNIRNSLFIGNTSPKGGAINIDLSTGEIAANQFISNTASFAGGAISLEAENGPIQINANRFEGNHSIYGGAIASMAGIQADGNIFLNNRASEIGGAADLGNILNDDGPCSTRITNSLIAGNQAKVGSGIVIGGHVCLSNNTIAANRGLEADGVGITVWYAPPDDGLWLTNTIIVSQTTGISYTWSAEYDPLLAGDVSMVGTLWGAADWANDQDWNAPLHFTATHNLWGDPRFVDPANGDFHLSAISPAIDRGLDSGVTHDLDGDTRPSGAGYDLGADEYTGVQNQLFLTILHRRQGQ